MVGPSDFQILQHAIRHVDIKLFNKTEHMIQDTTRHMIRCRQTDAERREADSEFQIKSREASGRHTTPCWQTDAKRHDEYSRDADTIFHTLRR